MTTPIQIPLISTSPPASPVAKQQIRPEKPGEFEQILKKTCETSQAEADSVQPDQAVKEVSIKTNQMEVKPVTEEKLTNASEEQSKIVDEAQDQVMPVVDVQMLPVMEQVPIAVPIVEITLPVEVKTPSSTSEKQTLVQGKGNAGVMTDPTGHAPNLQNAQYGGDKTADVEPDIHLDEKVSPDANGSEIPAEVAEGSFVKEQQQPKMESSSAPVTSQDNPQIPQAKYSTESTGEPTPQKPVSLEGSPAATITTQPSVNSIATETVRQPGNMFQVGESDQQGPEDTVKPSIRDSKTQEKEQPQTNSATPAKEVPVTAEKMKVEAKKVPFDAKPDAKVDMQAPPAPEGAEKPPPASSPGVVHEQLRMDAPIEKMTEPARLAEAQTIEILRQISRQIAGRSHAGSQTVRIQLHPEELGQIDLRITTTSQGTSISMVADQSSTGKLLESQIAQLKQTLIEAGVQMADVHVGQQASQQSFREQQLNQHPQRHNSFYSGADELKLGETDQMFTESKISQIDFRI
jgi:flagellar hook-length control protein FliK